MNVVSRGWKDLIETKWKNLIEKESRYEVRNEFKRKPKNEQRRGLVCLLCVAVVLFGCLLLVVSCLCFLLIGVFTPPLKKLRALFKLTLLFFWFEQAASFKSKTVSFWGKYGL